MVEVSPPLSFRGRRMYFGLGAVLVLLYGLVAVALISFQRLARATDLNIHSYEVLDAAQEVRIAAVNIQTGYRGYVLTGDSIFLEPLEEGRTGFVRGIETLRRITAGEPQQSANIDRAETIHADWETIHIDPGLAIRGTLPDSGIDVAELVEQINPERGRAYLNQLDGVLDEIRAIEMELLAVRREQMGLLERRTTLLLILGGIFGLLAASTFATMVGHQATRLFQTNRDLSREVGERRRAELSAARASRNNELLLEAAGEGICGLDSNGRISFLNPAAEATLGWSTHEAQGRIAHELFHHSRADGSAYPVDVCPIQASLADGVTHKVEDEVFWRRDGSCFQVGYIATPIVESGEITGAVVTFSDITDRRAVARMKDEFVSVVSHELRTPLTAIRGSLGLLASGSLGTLPERGQRMLEIASQNTDRLVRLINDILDIERIESGKVVMQMKELEVAELIEQAVESVRGLAEDADISLSADQIPGRVWGDPDRLIQVLTNLLGNAIKFSESGSSVGISAERLHGNLELIVTDQGRGIPEDKLETIFGRFQQVDASDSRKKGGTGLGLAIARSIIEQHGGEIWAESFPGSGSRFHFTLPVHGENESPEVHAPQVLLVATATDVSRGLHDELRDQGYRVVHVETGKAAVDAVRAERPVAILMQVPLADSSGYADALDFRREEATREIPIVMFGVPNGVAPPVENSEWATDESSESIFHALRRSLNRSRSEATILIVEDDTDLAEVLATMFSARSIRTLHADSCDEARRIVQRVHPDLVILDLLLEGEDGFDLVRHFRGSERLRTVPLVVYSALDLTEEQRGRLTLGRTEFVTKGRVPPEKFEVKVVELLDALLPSGTAHE